MYTVVNPRKYPWCLEEKEVDLTRIYTEVNFCCAECEQKRARQKDHCLCSVDFLYNNDYEYREEAGPILTDSGWRLLISSPHGYQIMVDYAAESCRIISTWQLTQPRLGELPLDNKTYSKKEAEEVVKNFF